MYAAALTTPGASRAVRNLLVSLLTHATSVSAMERPEDEAALQAALSSVGIVRAEVLRRRSQWMLMYDAGASADARMDLVFEAVAVGEPGVAQAMYSQHLYTLGSKYATAMITRLLRVAATPLSSTTVASGAGAGASSGAGGSFAAAAAGVLTKAWSVLVAPFTSKTAQDATAVTGARRIALAVPPTVDQMVSSADVAAGFVALVGALSAARSSPPPTAITSVLAQLSYNTAGMQIAARVIGACLAQDAPDRFEVGVVLGCATAVHCVPVAAVPKMLHWLMEAHVAGTTGLGDDEFASAVAGMVVAINAADTSRPTGVPPSDLLRDEAVALWAHITACSLRTATALASPPALPTLAATGVFGGAVPGVAKSRYAVVSAAVAAATLATLPRLVLSRTLPQEWVHSVLVALYANYAVGLSTIGGECLPLCVWVGGELLMLLKFFCIFCWLLVIGCWLLVVGWFGVGWVCCRLVLLLVFVAVSGESLLRCVCCTHVYASRCLCL